MSQAKRQRTYRAKKIKVRLKNTGLSPNIPSPNGIAEFVARDGACTFCGRLVRVVAVLAAFESISIRGADERNHGEHQPSAAKFRPRSWRCFTATSVRSGVSQEGLA